MPAVLYALAFTAGVTLIIQVGVNAALRNALGSPLIAGLASFVVGSVAIAAFVLLTRTPWPARAQLLGVPLWAWSGGALGAFYVISTVVTGPRLGAATLLALVVLGQLVTALAVDHFGWLGFPQHPLTLVRLGGAALLFGGVLLITR
ncbi:MAG: DMT family transporter [Steroidobacteraceae bacterium]